MGLANLVPGVSGGTMILALGLYDRFISSIAELTTLRWSKSLFVFMALIGSGLLVALLSMSGPAVWLVSEHRWIAYSIFVGLTLGGVPELIKLCGGLRPGALIAGAVGVAIMVALANSSASSVPPTWINLVWIGALAASSMILPGISGSYLLLIFGLYETVVGSLSLLKEEPVEAIGILVPVGIGAAIGIAALSNILKVALEKRPVSSHGLLLGLLVGSVVGLWPFQEAVHPDLANRPIRKGIELVVLEGADAAQVNEERGLGWTDEDVARATAEYGGKTKNELKALSNELRRFAPSGGQIAGAVGLLVLGFGATLLLGRGRPGAR
ncbi:hypothetical protein Pla86_18350 [Planctomycetes bacterium Pla86]|uniref:DUF368 domain-containing protein n=2 Tax=Engelhardtia mirabilis TaxID=2528011 RepID=A0A518BIF1_9BACT|nr:hypothetical protein Pla133_18360 [Planctomycetes bacterium Pla133]QDV01086.1 hypothetical protein Pla86_18350 [Planctomycetes bacterium Pla86]